MNRIILYIFLLLLFPSGLLRAAVRVVASAPSVVAQGEQFRLEYEVNTQDVKSAQVIEKIPGFDILYGPSKSSSYSMQIINGHQSSVSSVTYGYTLMAQKTGTFSLPPITVNVGGKNYTSNTVRIKVVAGNANAANGGSSGQRGGSSHPSRSSSSTPAHISNKDLFITVTANKTRVYEQEPVLLTYRVYTRVDLRQLGGKMPDLKGFMVKEVPLPQQKSFSVDSYNGQNYNTTVWSQYVMFPQQTGKLTIPSIKFDGIVAFADPNVDILDAFFNGQSGSIERKKTIMTPSLNIHVIPLPEKPAGFSGAVGNFTIKSILKTPHPRENESLNLQLQISGTGHVDLLKAPVVKFPAEFDTYAPQQNAQSKLTAAGMTGTMTIDYVTVPKHKGKYTIPPVDFTYFDTSTNTYKTIHTQPVTIDVAKGEKNIYSDKQQEILAKSDIRYIKTGSVRLHHEEDLFWNRSNYWLCYLAAVMAFIAVFYYLRRRSALQGDLVGQRIRGANRAATLRMKKAGKLLHEHNTEEFYEETLRALQGYVSDKLSIPVSDLTKDRILEEFRLQQVPQELADSFIHLQDDCELFRYSQAGSEQKSADEIYDKATEVIGSLDRILKKKRK